jgi:hypothetical protein
MAEALKTFKEGEDILASDTNSNNQFLLSKLSDNAAQVQQYVEGEVASIKSNVSSVQATLQNNITTVSNTLNNALKNLFIAITPDYAKRVSLEAKKQYKATSSGVLYLRVPIVEESISASITINGISFDLGSGLSNREGNHSSVLLLPVAKGDAYTIDAGTSRSWFTAYFIPYRGLGEAE